MQMKRVPKPTEVSRFLVVSESGEKYTIVEYQGFINAGAGDHPNAIIPGRRYLETPQGIPVKMIGEDTYMIEGNFYIFKRAIE